MFRFRVVPFLLILLLLIPVILWYFTPKTDLEVTVLTKTVPDTSYREHRGLFWVLNHLKYQKRDGTPYRYQSDYYGYQPTGRHLYDSIKSLPEDLLHSHLIYIADTYGVYEDDFYEVPIGERSRLIYGGLEWEEIDIILEALYNGATLIAEFNTLATPTHPVNRKYIYDILGVTWSGWIGRYFNSLQEGGEVPPWAIRNYEIQYRRKWEYEREGFLMVHEDDTIVVLEGERHLLSKGAVFTFTETGRDYFQLQKGATYSYWFDVIIPAPHTEVLAIYSLELTRSGEEILKERGIPITFPAIVKNKTLHYRTYYFAGDYADYPEVSNIYQIAFWDRIRRFFSIDYLENLNAFYWRVYVPVMKTILSSLEEQVKPDLSSPVYAIQGDRKLLSRMHNQKMQIYQGGKWVDFLVKGVNLGTALPGKWFTQFPANESLYREWLQMMAEMNLNTVRVYTLLDPAFYRALYNYNLENPTRPLYLLQEIWPEEHPQGDDLLAPDYLKDFFKEIEYVVDAIHGNIHIPQRQFRAHGRYYVDVSPYLLGYLVGREFEPEEVLATDSKHQGISFFGNYFYTTSKSTPTENWIAKTCDYLVAYQAKKYNWYHPVALVSWPPLDPMEHQTEWDMEQEKPLYNDMVSVDIRNIKVTDALKAGFFGAYHIYPNYPDFINNELAYDLYFDEEGRFRYGGYLQHFMEYHENYGALVAEFGIATGMGNAHFSPDGYHHGGLTEIEQAEGIIRMMEAILAQGYMGGVIFAWMDEWAKKTWTTEPFMIPYERQVLWHNAIDPEQNYGIMAIETIRPKELPYSISSNGLIRRINLGVNEAFFFIDLHFQRPIDLQEKTLLIGIDTYDRRRGEYLYQEHLPVWAPSGMEFLIELQDKEGRLLVTPSYNHSHYHFSSQESVSGIFEELTPLINKGVLTRDGRSIPAIYEEGSILSYGPFRGYTHHWYVTQETLHLRLPWGRLGVTDPSRGLVLDDDRIKFATANRDAYQVVETEGFLVTALLLNNKGEVLDHFSPEVSPFRWDYWELPTYRQRLKDSYPLLKKYFGGLEFPSE